MSLILSSAPGTVVTVQGTGSSSGSGAVISVDGFTDTSAIVIGFNVKLETDVSYMRALSDNFYVFPFGDKPSDLKFECLLAAECNSSKADYNKSLKQIAAFYKTNRVTFSNAKVVKIVLGGGAIVLSGLVTEITIDGSVDGMVPSVRAAFTMKAWLENA